MQWNIVWGDGHAWKERRRLMKKLIAALAAALSIVGCTKTAVPIAPSDGASAAAMTGDFRLTGTIAGRTEAGAVPLAGASIDVSSGQNRRSAVTDVDGSFTVEGLGSGTWTLSVAKLGFLSEAMAVSVDGDTTVSLELERAEKGIGPDRPYPYLRIR